MEKITINFLGDSITEGAIVPDPTDRFVNRIAEETGWDCRNYGIGGTRIARQSKASQCTRFDVDFNARVLCMDHNADLIVVFGGTNDFEHGDAPLGQISDQNVYTFYGALHSLYTLLLEYYDEKQIIIITPLHRYDIALEPTLEEYVKAIRQVAAQFHFRVLDLFEYSELHPRTENVVERYFFDGVHPNEKGHAILANEILSFLLPVIGDLHY